MPYTPPSQRSPSTSNPQSPVLTRNHSYEAAPQQQQLPLRPGLPRSRSATYLHKHRRTPSLSDAPQPADAVGSMNGYGHGHQLHLAHSHSNDEKKLHAEKDGQVGVNGVQIVRRHVAGSLVIRTDGSIASTASESLTGSDEDDEGSRGRKLEDLAEKLRDTVISKRGHSPNRFEEDSTPAAPKSTPAHQTNGSLSPALSPEAKKISHSRSVSEIQLSKYASNLGTSSPAQGSSDSDELEDDDDELQMKPPLIRKKSGELVKPALRPASRRRPSSMPGTPTYAKAVHFNEDIEQVRHFLQVDRPIAVSAGSSPVETYDSESEYPFDSHKKPQVEWEIRTSNFPADSLERQSLPVRLERIFLSPDSKTLIGTVACANIAFQKLVVARFTLDYWKTTSEVVAEFNNDVRKKQAYDGYDRFNFNIKLSDQAHLESKTLLLCVRYNVNGQEFWDNNKSMNFQVDFVKKVVMRNAKVNSMQGTNGAGSLGAVPRSRHSPTGGRPRSFPAAGDDDFAASFEFGTGDSLLRNPTSSTFRLRNQPRRGSSFPDHARQRQQQAGQAFSTRYDFGASLTAALTNAQKAMGDRSGIDSIPAVRSTKQHTQPIRQTAPAVQPPADGPRPDKISSERPDLHSQEYNDLIQKFCYFGSGSGGRNTGVSSPQPEQSPAKSSGIPQTDGATAVTDSDSDSAGSAHSSASNSPPSPRPSSQHHHLHQADGAFDHHPNHPQIRSTTPPFHPTSPRLIAYRSPSPALSSSYQDYPYQGLPPQATQC